MDNLFKKYYKDSKEYNTYYGIYKHGIHIQEEDDAFKKEEDVTWEKNEN